MWRNGSRKTYQRSKSNSIELISTTEKYDILENISSGSFGQVCLGRVKEDSSEVAIKIIECCNMVHLSEVYIAEVSTVRTFNHENIVRIIDDFHVMISDMPKSYKLYVVFERMDMNLNEFICKFNIDRLVFQTYFCQNWIISSHRRVSDGHSMYGARNIGTTWYNSPEMLLCNCATESTHKKQSKYANGVAVDVWAAGTSTNFSFYYSRY